MSAHYSERLARANNAITDQLQACRAACEHVSDDFVRLALRSLCEAVADVRVLAKLLPLATQEIREDLVRQARIDAAAERREG